jgi:hypothetical protein
MKKKMGELLEALRDAKVGSVMAFSLAETSKAANALQILEAAKSSVEEECVADDASTTTTSVTIRNPSEEEITVQLKE